jgi:hypothetical protein
MKASSVGQNKKQHRKKRDERRKDKASAMIFCVISPLGLLQEQVSLCVNVQR